MRRSQESGPGLNRRELLKGTALGAAGTMAGTAVVAAPAQPAHAAQSDFEGFPEPHYIRTNDHLRMAVYAAGEGVPVVLSHGFPELAFSWRHQIPALADAGFHVLAPDQRGYGNTQARLAIDAYGIVDLCADLVGLVDAYGLEKAVFCGHDWGGGVVWAMPRLHPDRVLGVIGVNTPTSPPPPSAPIEMLRRLRGEDNYVVAFQQPFEADSVLESDVRKVFSLLMRRGTMDAETFNALPGDAPERKFQLLNMIAAAPDDRALPGEPLLDEQELEYYVRAFERSGFTGGINWYRNIDRNWRDTKDLPLEIAQPCLYVGAEDDVVLPPSSANGMERFIPDLTKHTIADCGHWTQQDKPEELNEVLIGWLREHFRHA